MFDLDDLFARNRALFGDLRMEAADDGEPDDETDGEKPDDADGEGEQSADEADKKQEEKNWKAEFEAQKRINRTLERKNKRTFEDFQKLQEESKKNKPDDDEKPDLDKIRAEARAEAETAAMRERVMDKIEAKAGAKFGIDTEDVAALLMRRHDLEDFLDDGKIDVEAITEALNDLLEKQPRLAATVTQGDEKKFKGGADGGARGKASKSQLTEADVKRLAADGKHTEIEQARLDGRLNELLGIT